MYNQHTAEERDAAAFDAATDGVSDINDFMQEMFIAINQVLRKNPKIARKIDEEALRDEVELRLLQDLDGEITGRLSDYPWLRFNEVSTYKTNVLA